MRESDRYLKIVEWSEEDGCYVGTAPGLLYGGVHGHNETAVYAELCEAVEEAVEIYKADGKPLPDPTAGKKFSGRFVLRMPPELHKKLAIRALQHGESLNAFCREVLEGAAK